MERRWLVWILFIFSFIGMVGSLIATYQYFQILQTGFEEKSFCNINEFINCDVAYASSYAKLGNIPVSWLGFTYYLWISLLTGWILFKKTYSQEIASFAWVLTAGGIVMTFYKAYSLYALKVLCLVCLAMYFVNLVLFFGWHAFLKIGVRNFTRLALKPKFSTLAILTAILFGGGWITIAGYQNKIMKESKLNVSTEEIVSFHFRQSQYQFEVDKEAPVWGNPNAKITVVEFSDFQCPFCKHAAFHLKPVLSEFRDKVRLYFYHYPLDQNCNEQITSAMHDQACLAAQAAVCATKMGDFWNYHDAIFRNQKGLNREKLLELAEQRGWEKEAFGQCIDAPETLAKVKTDIQAASKIYVTSTPTVLVNNRRVKYWSNPEVLRAILREEIRKN